MCTRTVIGTHSLRVDSRLSSHNLQMRPSLAGRKVSSRGAVASSASGPEDPVCIICFPTLPFSRECYLMGFV